VTSFDSIDQGSGRIISGLLGSDFLRRFTVEIDPTEHRINLFDPLRYRYSGPGGAVPLEFENGDFFVHAKVRIDAHHTYSARLLLDTGSSRQCVIFSQRFLARHRQELASLKGVSGVVGVGLRGQFFGQITRIPELRVGRFVALAPTAALPDEHADSVLRFPADGAIGDGILANAGVVFDFARGRLIFEAPEAPLDACSYDRSGLFLMASYPTLGAIRVAYVVHRSPAFEAGVQPGDELLAIDGQAISSLRLGAVRESLAIRDTSRLLRLRRGNDTLAVTVRLRQLF
jgi:hypothetical protein